MLISFFFSYLENVFVVFYLSLYFILAQAASGGDTTEARSHTFFTYTARTATSDTALRIFIRYSAYGVVCLPI